MNGMKTYPANIPLEAGKLYLVFRRGLDTYSFDKYLHTSPLWEHDPDTHDKHWLYSRPDDILAWAELPKPPRYGRRKRKDEGWDW